jgi:hypothetical protein
MFYRATDPVLVRHAFAFKPALSLVQKEKGRWQGNQ